MNPFWVRTEGIRLSITPRPRGGDWLGDDVRFLRQSGVDVLVSALTPIEADELGLLEENNFCQINGLEFLSFPIEDRSVPPSFHEFDLLLNSVIDYLRSGKAVGVHCRAGVGRSSMIVASVLIRTGFSVDSAFRAIQEARGCTVPDTPEQRQWVERYASRSSGLQNTGK
jgi:protein-tyrosine phosphatase